MELGKIRAELSLFGDSESIEPHWSLVWRKIRFPSSSSVVSTTMFFSISSTPFESSSESFNPPMTSTALLIGDRLLANLALTFTFLSLKLHISVVPLTELLGLESGPTLVFETLLFTRELELTREFEGLLLFDPKWPDRKCPD